MQNSAEEFVRRAYQAFSERDLDALMKIADPQIEIHTVTGMIAGRTALSRASGPD
jgi:ketosteroid isomerase-like protein